MSHPTSATSASVLVHGPVFLDVVMSGLNHMTAPGEEQWVEACALMPGGWANQAVAAARLGLEVSLCARLGHDEAGLLVRDALTREHIDLSASQDVDRQNVTVSLALGNERAMTTVGTEEVPPLPQLSYPPAALVASLPTLIANRERVSDWRTATSPAQQPTLVVGDVGWDPTGRWDAADLDGLDLLDVFTPNEAEACAYTRSDDPVQAARALARRCPLVVVTCGPDGVVAATPNELISLPATPVVPTDTTGAGDSFTAGLLWALHHHLPLRTALSAASLTASATLRRPGGSANAPTLDDLAAHTRGLSLPDSYDLSFLDLIG